MYGIGNGLGEFFFLVGKVICVLVIIIIGLLSYFFYSGPSSDDSIRSTEKIEPKIELEIVNNKVDTIYVYERPTD